ncbi:hypothetical protein Tco_0410748 [Tanacetum coccineum]
MVISSPCLTDIKNWLVQSKRLWVINAPCYCNEALTSPVQTATGKDTSNPLMADDHKDKECSQEEIGYNPQKLNQKKLEVNKSMIGSLMYLTAFRPDIMFAVCACVRFQVTRKTSHIHAMKRIFRYLKGQPKLGLWYPRDSLFDLEAFSDSDYAGVSLDRKSTTGGCQFLGKKIISWQCKKQTIVANSTTEAEYVAAANCCGQNPVFHSKTHIEIMHHFIRDSYEKKLIQVIKIHTDHNVADLLTKAFDVSSGPIHLVVNETVIKEWEDIMERAATTTSSLEAEQDSEKPKESNGFEGILDFLNASSIKYALTVNPIVYESCIQQFWATAKTKTVNEECHIQALVDKLEMSQSLRRRVRRLSDLILQEKVSDLEKAKTAQANEIASLKKRVKVESSNNISLGEHEDASKQGRKIVDLDADAKVTLVDDTQEMNDDNLIFDTDKKDQVALDEEMARNLKAQMQAELIEEERLARQKEEEANIALIES